MSSLPFAGITSDDIAREMGLRDVGGPHTGTEPAAQAAANAFLRQALADARARRFGGSTPSTSLTPPSTPDMVERDFRLEVGALFPWLPTDAMAVVARGWADTGVIEVGLGQMRQDPRYDTIWFPGNRRDDGSTRLSEQEYLSWVEGYRMDLQLYGLNPNIFTQRFRDLIEHGVSPQRLAARLAQVHAEIGQNIDQVRQVYAAYYGRGDLTNQAVFAMAIDPTVSENILSRRITAAQIGGHAMAFGFDRGVGRAEELAAVGLDQSGAQAFFTEAARAVPRLGAFARRFHDPFGQDFGIGAFEEAVLFGDPAQRQRMQRLFTREAAMFSPGIGYEAGPEGEISGLRQR